MRIYASTKKNTNAKIIEPFFHETRHLSYIWSPDNKDLFQVECNKIYYVKQNRKGEKMKTLLGKTILIRILRLSTKMSSICSKKEASMLLMPTKGLISIPVLK